MLIQWLPLALTWLMLTCEAPTITALVARSPTQEADLAAFGVALSLVFLVESLILMLQALATNLCRDAASYRVVRNVSVGISLATIPLALILASPWMFTFFAQILGLPASLVEMARETFLLLAFWPCAVGFRRFMQGIMVREGHTRGIVVAAVVRYGLMAAVSLWLLARGDVPGAHVGAWGLNAGVFAETLLTVVLSRRAVRATLQVPSQSDSIPSWVGCLRYYAPLAMTTFVVLAAPPLIMLSIGHAAFPVESYAVLPVVFSFTLILRSVGISIQEIAIAWLDKGAFSVRAIRGFLWWLIGIIVAISLALLLSGATEFWYDVVAGLEPGLVGFALPSTAVFFFLPWSEIVLSWQRARFLHIKRPIEIFVGGAAELLSSLLVLFALLLTVPSLSGAMIGALAVASGRLFCLLVQFLRGRRLFNAKPA